MSPALWSENRTETCYINKVFVHEDKKYKQSHFPKVWNKTGTL